MKGPGSELKTAQVPKFCDAISESMTEGKSIYAEKGFFEISSKMVCSDEVMELIICEMKGRGITCSCARKLPKKFVLRVNIEK